MGDRASMKDVFIQCQTGLQGHGKLMKTLNKIYDKTEFEAFWSELQHYLKYAMIIFKREPAVERMIDFVSKFAPTLCKKTVEKGVEDGDDTLEEEDSVADNRLLQEMFDFLLSSHSARERGVRFRCCQLINKLLANLGEDAQIDDELYDRLYECMLERLKDKCPMVRYHAVYAMARLQDPSDDNCPVIKAYLFLLNCDPNADVRRAVLASIAPSTKTLASIIGRTRDVKDTVRKTAYEVLAEKIHIKALSIASRLQLINEGLIDRSEMVQQACSGKLLQAWMRTVGGNILDLLKSLDVEDSTDICTRVLETLFKASSIQDMMTSFNILDEKLLIPTDVLNSESALYWYAVCKFIHGMGADGDEYMEKVLPTAVDFCAYMQRYVDELKTEEDPEIQLGREFIIEQLLLITSFMDTADVASKKALETLLHNMLMADHVSHRLVKFIITQICSLRGSGENMVAYFAETVSEIREPITVVEKDIEEEKKRQINLKIAGIRVQLNQLREDLDEAVKGQDFEKAASIKSSIAQLDVEKRELLETSEPVREEIRTEKNDPFTLMKCQTIISEMLQQLKLNNVSSTLQMMIESQIVPGIQNEDAEVRNMAMQGLGLCCYLSKDLLVTYIPLFMQASQIDVEGVRVTALQVLFDLLLIYGLEIVDASEGSSNESADNRNSVDGITSETASSSSDSRNGTASKLVAIICSFLDGESSDLRTCAAEGLSKLLLSGRVVSSKILSHLVLLWYNPLSEDDTHLRDCLGTFFPLYALASRSNQEVVEEAFLPTLRTLLNAPATSPLAEVDVNNVAELLVQLTNTKLLTANQNNTEISLDNPGHDNLSETVCNEILSKPESAHVKLWVRILNQMDVSPDNEVVLKDLRILAYKMAKTVKEKTCLKGLQKFEARINELASKFVSDNNDLENIEIESVGGNTDDSADETHDTSSMTPKRKRVRGLYSQNMTLAMESEAEIDIADESAVEVDASCLMSRTTVETPSKRSRKNTTTTELAEEDVFLVPNEPQKPAEDVNKESAEDEEKQNSETAEAATSKSPQSKSPERGRPVEKKAASPKKTSPRKSPAKSQEKRKASRSPAGVSPEKRLTSESPARRSQEKRKASKSPARDKKRVSKSPARSASSSRRKGSSSPEKRMSSNSPIKEAGERRASKSPVKSPVRGNAEKRKSSSPPNKTSGKKDDKGSPAPAKKSKESEKAAAPKSKMPLAKKNAEESKKSQSPEKKKGAANSQDKNKGKAIEKNVRKALPKSVASEKTRLTASASSESRSPRLARGVKPNDTAKVSATTNSPRPARKAGNKLVADTPEQVTRRVSTRSLANTPDTSSQRGKGTPRGRSVMETPENVIKQKPEQKKAPYVRAGAAIPVVTLNKVKTPQTRVTRGTPRASASSASESSPEKVVKSTPRTTRAKVLSTDDSSTSSPDSVKQSKPAKGKPASQKKTVVDTTTDDDEEEVSFRRRAKPSRRSATASASTSMVTTPQVGGRTTRSSLSQSSIESPTVRSPRNPRPGVPVTKQPVKKVPTTTSEKPQQTTASRRVARGGESSQNSTISLISSQRTTTSSQRSTISSQRSTISSQRSTTSTVSGKSDSSKTSKLPSRSSATNASRRSKSADSSKTEKVTAPVTKVTRSAVATRPTRETKAEPGKLKRPLRSKPSDRK